MAQDSYIVSRKFKKLTLVNKEFESMLDTILKKEQNCNDYNENLFWTVSFTKLKEDEYIINITLQRELSETYKYLGYFKKNGVVFIVLGEQLHTDFFSEEETEQVFTSKNMKIPFSEDYSTWLFGYKEKTLFLRESYPLPCK